MQKHETSRPIFSFLVNNVPIKFLVDTGASVSIISSDLVRKFNIKMNSKPTNLVATSVTGQPLRFDGQVTLPLQSQNFTYWHKFHVWTGQTKAILGMDFLSKNEAKIKCSEGIVILKNDPEPLLVNLSSLGSHNLRSTREVCIPPKETRIIKVRSNLKGQICSVQKTHNIVEGLYNTKTGSLRIPVINDSEEEIHLQVNEIVAGAMLAEVAEMPEIGETTHIK